MKPVYLQPSFLLGIFLGLGTCLMLLSLVHHHGRSHRRLRRDIKTIPAPEDTTESQPKTWTRVNSRLNVQLSPQYPDITSSTELQDAEHDSLRLGLELAKEKRRKGLLHSEVLNVHGPEAVTAAEMTWASGVGKVHTSVADPVTTSAYQHIWEAVRKLCREPLEKEWYLLVKDSIYVNAERLKDVLLRLSAEDSLVLGVPSADNSYYCSLEAGLLFSRKALQTTCAIVETCTAAAAQPQLHTHTRQAFGHCLEKETGLVCSDVLKVSSSTYLPSPDPSTLQPAPNTLTKTLFVGPVTAPDDLYKIHLIFTEHKISLMQQHVFWLAAQMELDLASKQRAKRNSPDFEQAILQSHAAILNGSSEALTEYFDSSGYVYTDSCVVTKNNVSESHTFRRSAAMVKHFLKTQFGSSVAELDYFGFQTIKPLSGLEYQFYYVHEDHVDKRGYYYDKLYQLIVRQDYGEARVEAKRTRDVEDITIVTIADDLTLLRGLLLSLVENCVRISKTNSRCSVLLLYDTALFNTDSGFEQLQSIISSIDSKTVDVRTLDIGMSAGIMNNFQRAVVSVHETLIDNSLIVFLHPKSIITEQFLLRCQVNTVPGASAYFPVPFQFTRDSSQITSDSGFWKNTDYDTFCVHTKDLQKLLILPKSPQMLYQVLISVDGLEVRRLADTGIWREWDDGICSEHGLVERGQNKCQQDFMYRNL